MLNAASSSVGLAAISVARRIGAAPIALTRTGARKEALLRKGAAEVAVTGSEDVAENVSEDVVERVRASTSSATGARGAELVLDAVAGSGGTDLVRAVAEDGMLLIYGALRGGPTPYPGVELGLPPVSMRMLLVFEVTRRLERLCRAEAFIASGRRSGAFRPVVDRVFPLDGILAAHRCLESNDQVGKVVVTVPH